MAKWIEIKNNMFDAEEISTIQAEFPDFTIYLNSGILIDLEFSRVEFDYFYEMFSRYLGVSKQDITFDEENLRDLNQINSNIRNRVKAMQWIDTIGGIPNETLRKMNGEIKDLMKTRKEMCSKLKIEPLISDEEENFFFYL